MQEQGIKIKEHIVYQDNESAMLLETNSSRSSTKRTKHMSVRLFSVKDRILDRGVKLEHCPTLNMVGNYFTKTLQGK